jgi:hypothetical protein
MDRKRKKQIKYTVARQRDRQTDAKRRSERDRYKIQLLDRERQTERLTKTQA